MNDASLAASKPPGRLQQQPLPGHAGLQRLAAALLVQLCLLSAVLAVTWFRVFVTQLIKEDDFFLCCTTAGAASEGFSKSLRQLWLYSRHLVSFQDTKLLC